MLHLVCAQVASRLFAGLRTETRSGAEQRGGIGSTPDIAGGTTSGAGFGWGDLCDVSFLCASAVQTLVWMCACVGVLVWQVPLGYTKTVSSV